MNKVIMKLEHYDKLIGKMRTLEEENMIIESEFLDARKELEHYIESYSESEKKIMDLLEMLVDKNSFIGEGDDIKCFHVKTPVEIAEWINENYKEDFIRIMKGRNN